MLRTLTAIGMCSVAYEKFTLLRSYLILFRANDNCTSDPQSSHTYSTYIEVPAEDFENFNFSFQFPSSGGVDSTDDDRYVYTLHQIS